MEGFLNWVMEGFLSWDELVISNTSGCNYKSYKLRMTTVSFYYANLDHKINNPYI